MCAPCERAPFVGYWYDALALIQIDHTVANVIVFVSRHRNPIGRTWLTVVINVGTRWRSWATIYTIARRTERTRPTAVLRCAWYELRFLRIQNDRRLTWD